MRPTDLHFRSIRERTPEPDNAPLITRDGSPLFAQIQEKAEFIRKKSCDMQKQPHFGFGSKNSRFSNDYSNHFRQTSSNHMRHLGPGTYQADEQYKQLTQPACGVKYKHLTVGQKMAQTGDFHLENGRLVYEPSYRDPRKKTSKMEQYLNLLQKQSTNRSFRDSRAKPSSIADITQQFLNERTDLNSRNSQYRPYTQGMNSSIKHIQQQPLDYSNVNLNQHYTSNSNNKKRSKSPYNFTTQYSNKTFQRQSSRNGGNRSTSGQSFNPQNVIIFMGSTININPQNTYIMQPEQNLSREKTSISPIRYQNAVDNCSKLNQTNSNFYNPTIISSTKISTKNFSRQKSQRQSDAIYRILTSDSNVNSGYFKHGFQCPTQSSTQQRKKPIAYDLEIQKNSSRQRPSTGIRVIKSKRCSAKPINNFDLILGGGNTDIINVRLNTDQSNFEDLKTRSMKQQFRYGDHNHEQSQQYMYLDEPIIHVESDRQQKETENFKIFEDVKVFNKSSAHQNSSMNPNHASELQDQQYDSNRGIYNDKIIVNQETKSLKSEVIRGDKHVFSSLNLKNLKSDVNNTEEVQMNIKQAQKQKDKDLKSIENID